MVEQGRDGCEQEQDCLQYCFQVIINNLPRTRFERLTKLKPPALPRDTYLVRLSRNTAMPKIISAGVITINAAFQ